jgi:hypothetical protein
MGELGDTAEGVFADIKPLGKFQRLGWRRPEVKMKHMSSNIRHMPDYYCESGYHVEKYDALKWWNKSGNPVALFIWNSHLKQYALISWGELKRLISKARNEGIAEFESDGNTYYPIKWDWIAEGCIVSDLEAAA